MLKIIMVIIASSVLLAGCASGDIFANTEGEQQIIVTCGNITLDEEELLKGKCCNALKGCNIKVVIDCPNFDKWESLTPPYMPRPISAH